MIPHICAVFHPVKLSRVAHQNLVFRVSYILGIPVTDTVNEERCYFSRVFCSSVGWNTHSRPASQTHTWPAGSSPGCLSERTLMALDQNGSLWAAGGSFSQASCHSFTELHLSDGVWGFRFLLGASQGWTSTLFQYNKSPWCRENVTFFFNLTHIQTSNEAAFETN